MWVAFANAKATHIFSAKNIRVYATFNDQSFNDTLTNNIISFEQVGPDLFLISPSFGASGGLCFVIMPFPMFLFLFLL